MKENRKYLLGAAAVLAVWLGLALFAWFGPKQEVSVSERRKLDQMPELTAENVLSGNFMTDFESYSLDQFPLRDQFRQLKALFHYYCLGQKDNNGIYIAGGYAAKVEYPLDEKSVNYAISRFQNVYDTYLKDSGSKIYFTMAPDKGFYLAQANGYPAMDYAAMEEKITSGLPWASYVDVTPYLSGTDYYRTDTHWRQERLLPAAGALCRALGIPEPKEGDYTPTAVERPFYGVYYGQAALPMEPETIYYLQSDLLRGCTVFNYENNKKTQVYDLDKLDSRDLYDVFLSGAAALLTIENPNADTDRELIVFRDSFGSSMVPLLVQGYKTVTVVDIRYLMSSYLGNFIDFHGQDVLFLYSSLILNSSSTLK